MFSPRCDYSILRFARDVLLLDFVASSTFKNGELGSKESEVTNLLMRFDAMSKKSLDNSTYLFIEWKASGWDSVATWCSKVSTYLGNVLMSFWCYDSQQALMSRSHHLFLTVLIGYGKTQVVKTRRFK